MTAAGRDWYKDAVFYEVHVKAFMDANGDGVGDFAGLTERLDYLVELGVNCLWILPMYASPLRDDGYDIADFYTVHPAYGTLEDFQKFLDAAHARDLRVVADLVMNHTSDAHPWFQASRADPASPYAEYYVWSATDRRYTDARVIFVDAEKSNWTWDPQRKAYYWHRFFSHQPDLNYDHPAVRRAMLDVMRFWLDRGLDGFRCDAVPYLVERDGIRESPGRGAVVGDLDLLGGCGTADCNRDGDQKRFPADVRASHRTCSSLFALARP